MPVFTCKHNEKWRRFLGNVLFLVNIPLYYLMVAPAFYDPQPRLGSTIIAQIVHWSGPFFILYGLVLTFGHLFPKVKAGGPGYDPSCLLTEGVFRYVRHPQLGGLLSLSLGFSSWTRAVYHLYVNIFYFVIFFIHICMEEKVLLIPRFGEQYREYRKKVKVFFAFVF